MGRKEDLLKILEQYDLTVILPLIDEVIFIEGQLLSLRELPFIRIHPSDPAKQKATPAAKLYKELLQQYTNCIKVLQRVCGNDDADEESPLRKWVESIADQRKENMDFR